MSNNNTREMLPEEKESNLSTAATSIDEPYPNNHKAQESSLGSISDDERVTTVANDVEYASGFKLAAVIMALALSVFLVSLDMTIVATAIPKITDVSHFTASENIV
jgi:MFS transporter, DHA2 family, glioxin efflux transporter